METSNRPEVENENDEATRFASYMSSLEARVAQLEALLDVKLHVSTRPSAELTGLQDSKAGVAGTDNDASATRRGSFAPVTSPTAATRDEFINGTTTPLGPIDEGSATSKKSRVQSVIGNYGEFSLRFHELSTLETTESSSNANAQPSQSKNKTILRKVMNEYDTTQLIREEIEIDSIELRRLITQVCTCWSWASEYKPLQLSSPFPEFVWFWDDFKAACVPQEDDTEAILEAREDLVQLMGLLERSQLEPYFKDRDTWLASGTMKYDYLWTLFRPGTKVYVKSFLGEMQMFEVQPADYPYYSTTYGSAYSGSKYSNTLASYRNRPEWTEPSFPIHCRAFDWDGAQFNVYTYTFRIRKASKDTMLTISSQDVVPASFYRNQQGELNDVDLKESLTQRGKRFVELCTLESEKTQYKYNGHMLVDLPSGSDTPLAFMKPARLEEDEARSMYSGLEDGVATTEAGKSRAIMVNKVPYKGVFLTDTEGFMLSQSKILQSGLGEESYPPIGFLPGKLCGENHCSCIMCKASQLNQWQEICPKSSKNQQEEFCKSSERLAMCPPRILGHALKEKMWAQVLVKHLKEFKLEDGARYFNEQLQLEKSYKDMLLAFVKNHQYSSKAERSSNADNAKVSKSFDTAEGKGQGLAVLLHGPPGVGKTLTAETIALATGRPLLSVSVAEIGTDASQAEGRLNEIFFNAERWRAVLLMDEADVFLEARVRSDDPNRNAMVSVLLRCLEYYEGIIILTTNRIKSIDIAVQSRMHLAIQYLNLTPDQMLAIYKNLLDDVPDDMLKERRKYLDEEIKRTLCGRRSQMNGRQIRNIVSTARALAASGNEKLEFEHLRTVYDSTAEFLEGLKDVNERAKLRNQVDEA